MGSIHPKTNEKRMPSFFQSIGIEEESDSIQNNFVVETKSEQKLVCYGFDDGSPPRAFLVLFWRAKKNEEIRT